MFDKKKIRLNHIKSFNKNYKRVIDFFETVSEKGFKTLKLLDLIWLFLIYPLLLCLGYIIGEKIYIHFAT